MPRINCEIPADVHQAARVAALRLGISLKEYVVRALRAANEQAALEVDT